MSALADRRRANAPSAGTSEPVFVASLTSLQPVPYMKPVRDRRPQELRKIFLRTGFVALASGSAYLELPPSGERPTTRFVAPSSSLKISCAVHGPRPLARSALFSPNLALAVHVKYAPFASRVRRGYLRDQHERDLAIHLDTAIRGIILSDRWPKSGIELFVTILESQADAVPFNGSDDGSPAAPWGTMTTLAGCITAASAALVDAGIDCIETVSGGVAALVVDRDGGGNGNGNGVTQRLVLDPNPEEHLQVQAACVVGYLTARDEITEIWLQGDTGDATDQLIDAAVAAAKASATVLTAALLDTLAAGADSGVPHSV